MLIVLQRPSFAMGTCTLRHYQKSKGRGPPKLMSKTAEATGYSKRTVCRVVSKKKTLEGAVIVSPPKWYKAERKRILVDDFNVEAIRRIVHEFYRDKKYSTVESLLAVVKERGVFMGERVTLWKLLARLVSSTR